MTTAEQRTRDLVAAAEIQIIEERNQKGAPIPLPSRTGAGTHEDPIRYEHISADDPDRQMKRAVQRRQFTVDAKAGRVRCLSDLMISHGM